MLRRIPQEELRSLAPRDGFTIDDAELPHYVDLCEYVLSAIDTIDEWKEEPGALVPSSRDPGRRPEAGEDPLNAVVRWCTVAADCSGILSEKRIALKDSMAVAGVPMTCGSRVLAGYIPEQDAVVTERILEQGGQIVAITNMDDLAFSGGGDTSSYGYTRNPFDPLRTAGGSSGGSAAVLWYGRVDAALGGDQGGSIRVPAAWCGVVGLKPTHGLVPYTGIVGVDQTFDHAGPIARTVADAALLLQAIAGKHEADPRQRDVAVADYVNAVDRSPEDFAGVRIGLVLEGLGAEVGTDPAVEAAFREAAGRLQSLGADVREVSLPEHLHAGGIAFAGYVEGMTALLEAGGNGYHWQGRYAPDLALALRDGLDERGADLPAQVKLVLLVGNHLRKHYRGAVYAKAQNLRPWLREAYDRALADADVLLFPTTPGLPHVWDPTMPLAEHVKRGWAVLANTYPTDMTGHPALSMPAAESGGLPVGLMLVGRHFEDARLLALARTFERSAGWLPAASPRLQLKTSRRPGGAR